MLCVIYALCRVCYNASHSGVLQVRGRVRMMLVSSTDSVIASTFSPLPKCIIVARMHSLALHEFYDGRSGNANVAQESRTSATAGQPSPAPDSLA